MLSTSKDPPPTIQQQQLDRREWLETKIKKLSRRWWVSGAEGTNWANIFVMELRSLLYREPERRLPTKSAVSTFMFKNNLLYTILTYRLFSNQTLCCFDGHHRINAAVIPITKIVALNAGATEVVNCTNIPSRLLAATSIVAMWCDDAHKKQLLHGAYCKRSGSPNQPIHINIYASNKQNHASIYLAALQKPGNIVR